ncbi:MAG TPA: S8 family serine peptidase [Candidatus Thermoplasmatota archaeon]|nr:S8 family serine peptidase [Candidatus Thermoplasmatota archaeon]
MKGIVVVIAMFVVLGVSTASAVPQVGMTDAGPPQFASAGVSERASSGLWIVAFHELPEDRSTYAGQTVVSVNEDLRFFVVDVSTPHEFFATTARDDNVRYVERDLEVVRASLVPNDTHYANYQYDMKPATTNMELAWDKGFGTTSTKVCVGDTGQRRTHEDFQGVTWYHWFDAINGKTTAYDDNGHGSHVTGTIAAMPNNAKGVAGITKVAIGGVKLLNTRGSGTVSQVANGINSCTGSGAHIHSYSLGTTGDSSTIRNAINAALDAGAFIAAASGNGGCSNCVEYPAKYPGVTAVGSTGKTNVVSSFTSKGPELDFSAPGEDIPSLWTDKQPCTKQNADRCYVLSSGTSMATPHVAGLAALVKSNNPGFTSQQIYDRLKSTAMDLGASGHDSTYGWGLIRGGAA